MFVCGVRFCGEFYICYFVVVVLVGIKYVFDDDVGCGGGFMCVC